MPLPEALRRPSRRTVGIAAGVVSALLVATVGIALVRRGDDTGSTGAAPPAPVAVRTPKPANRSFEGVTTFRGNACRRTAHHQTPQTVGVSGCKGERDARPERWSDHMARLGHGKGIQEPDDIAEQVVEPQSLHLF